MANVFVGFQASQTFDFQNAADACSVSWLLVRFNLGA
jgi:hypothetical protein